MTGKNSRRLIIESLERRWLMAGDVSVKFLEGNLLIMGDDQANAISISSAEEPGYFIVTGHSTYRTESAADPADPAAPAIVNIIGEPTKINGKEEPLKVHGLPRNMVAHLKGGDDEIGIVKLRVAGNAMIQTDGGNDLVSIGSYVIPQDPRMARPSLIIRGPVAVGGNLGISTGDGDDMVLETMLSVRSNQILRTGSGSDDVTIEAQAPPPVDPPVDPPVKPAPTPMVSRLMHPPLPPKPPLPPRDVHPALPAPGGVSVQGSLIVTLGDGADYFRSVAPTPAIDPAVDVVLPPPLALSVGHNLMIHGGEGDDSISLAHVTARSVAVAAGQGADVVKLDHVAADMAFLDMGEGGDSLSIDHSRFANLAARLGDGDDELTIENTKVRGLALLDGGPGTDTLKEANTNSYGRIRRVNFEKP